MNTDGTANLPPRDPADIAGDSGDQAQDLRFAAEQEAIAAALAGHPRGDSDIDRGALIEQLEGEDPLDGLEEGDSSDDPVHGGDDITGLDPAPRAIAIDPDASTNPDEPEDE